MNSVDNNTVYESLRNEIIATQGTRTNLSVYMFSVYAIIFVLGFDEKPECFVLASVILIAFQSKINRSNYTIARISSFIRVIFEDEGKNGKHINWETVEVDEKIQKELKRSNNRLVEKISEQGSVFLGILSFVCYLIVGWPNIDSKEISQVLIKIIPYLIFVILSLVCLAILIVICGDYKIEKKDRTKMDKVFRKYKNSDSSKKMVVKNKK